MPIAKAIETQHRNAMTELKALQAAMEQQKANGLVIEEIDPALIDPSPYWDRDLRFLQDRRFADFVEDIRRNSQQSPALLRPHPTEAGRYEVCFGASASFRVPEPWGSLAVGRAKPLRSPDGRRVLQ